MSGCLRVTYMTHCKLKPRSCTRLLVWIPLIRPNHQHAPSTISSPTNIVDTTMAAVVPTIISTAATTATATAARATSVGIDDGLGSPPMIHCKKYCN